MRGGRTVEAAPWLWPGAQVALAQTVTVPLGPTAAQAQQVLLWHGSCPPPATPVLPGGATRASSTGTDFSVTTRSRRCSTPSTATPDMRHTALRSSHGRPHGLRNCSIGRGEWRLVGCPLHALPALLCPRCQGPCWRAPACASASARSSAASCLKMGGPSSGGIFRGTSACDVHRPDRYIPRTPTLGLAPPP